MTYKQRFIIELNKKIAKYDLYHSQSIKRTGSIYWALQAERLRMIRKKAEEMHGNEFVPKRFPSSEFLSLKLALNK